MSRPNILCVVLDAARRDSLEPYGAPAGSSPVTESLARRGTAVEAAFATGCWTAPSHISMFTGLMPRAAGLGRPPDGKVYSAKPIVEAHIDRLLPEVLRRAGYATSAVSANLWISERSGFATGFEDLLSVVSGRQRQLRREGLRARLDWIMAGVRAGVDDGAGEAQKALLRWIDQGVERPFFWFVNLVECHSPYLPPRPYNDLSIVDRARAAEEARRHLSGAAIYRACLGGFDIPDEAIERMRHLYQRSIRYMDDWLGRVLEGMDEAGLLEDTLVIVTSDHGENLGEGGLITHGFSLDNRLINVPFVMAGPGTRCDRRLLSLAELPRMIAEAIDLEEHPWRDDDLPPDVCAAQFEAPAARDDPGAAEALARLGLGAEALERISTSLTCVTDGRFKLLRRGEREEFVDLAQDPLELRSVPSAEASAPPGVLPSLRRAMAHPSLAAEAAPRELVDADRPDEDERARIAEQMRLLGYL